MFARFVLSQNRHVTTKQRRSFSSQERRAITLGTWSLIPSPHVVEILARFGFDFTIIDCEHGILNIETAENMIRAANASGITPYLRVPEKKQQKNDQLWS